MFDLYEETTLTDMYELHQNVTARFEKNTRWCRQGRKLIIRLAEKPSGLCSPVPDVALGDVVSFQVTTFPSVRVRGEKSKRICLNTDVERIMWFARKGEQHGFTFNHIPKLKTALVRNPWSSKPLVSTNFTGTLQVTDPVKFKDMLRNGIGSLKMGGNIMTIFKE